MAKNFPSVKTDRAGIDALIETFSEIDGVRVREIQKSAQVFPQAFHELRKLNATIIQSTEIELRKNPEDRFLKNIQGAAELMRNNFDILEALSNIEGMQSLPLGATVNVRDLIYKMKRIYLDRAMSRGMDIWVSGKSAIIKGSQKSFPIVPAVFIDNAIKYGKANTNIDARVEVLRDKMILTVENQSANYIDPNTCFNKGSRFASQSVEGGGFGLFIAKEIVAAHSGTIACNVRDSKVSMTVTIPLWDVMTD